MSKETMDCNKICELLAAFLDEETTAEEQARIESHLGECPRCRREMEALRSTQAGLRRMLFSAADESEPSPQVWSRIRVQIEDEKRRPRGLSRWFNRNLIWQVATAAAAIVFIIFAATVWNFGGMGGASQSAQPEIPDAAPAPAPEESMPALLEAPPVETAVSASVRPDSFSNSYGKSIHIETTLNNTSAEEVTLSPYPPAMQIVDPFNYETVRSFAAGNTTLLLEPGQTATHSYTWDQRNDGGEQVEYGYYYLQPDVMLKWQKNQDTATFGGASPAEILILPEGGVVEKTVTVARTETAAETPITLERVEMTATNTRFFASTVPQQPTTPIVKGNGMRAPGEFFTARAQYRIDDGPTRELGFAEIGISNDGTELVWAQPYIGPVPQTAHTLTFTITAVGEREGRWEFTVPLK